MRSVSPDRVRLDRASPFWVAVHPTIDGFQLTLGLQDKASRDLPAADGRHQLFQLGDLADIRHFVDQASHMHGQSAVVFIIRFFAKQVEHLGVRHGYQEIEGIVRVRND